MARKPSPALTDAEAQVMAVLWRHHTASVGEVVNVLRETRAVTYSTVQTILRILETKGYVAHDKVVRAFVYRPLVTEQDVRRSMVSELTTLLFDGSSAALMTHLLRSREMEPGDLDRVKRMIAEAEGGERNGGNGGSGSNGKRLRAAAPADGGDAS